MLIPTIIPSSINPAELDDLMQIGFGFVKLPNENLIKTIQTCIQVARKFFQSSIEEKEKWQLKKTLNPGDRYQGYVLRSQSKNIHAIEQIFFEPDAPFGPYAPYANLIQEINAAFMDLIFLPLMSAIFKRLQFPHSNFVEATTHPYCSLVFQSCPAIGGHKDAIRLNAHKDFGLLTILFFEESGLEVKFQNDWKAIPPQEGCVVVNLGNAIELMTGKKCHSALHRVTNATDNRISMVYFTNPNYQQPVRNYAEDKEIAKTGEQFFKQQFSEYYETDH
jgi:isopenicillin N synthase-like dioxygenase